MPLQRDHSLVSAGGQTFWTVKRRKRRAPVSRSHQFNCIVPVQNQQAPANPPNRRLAVTGVRQYNVLENNGTAAHQAIAHVHFHIIPKPNSIEGLGVGWPQQAFDHKAGAELAAKLRTAVG